MIQDSREHFIKQNDIGKAGEEVVAGFLEARGNTILEKAGNNYFPDYDLKILTKLGYELTFEVKTDTSKYANVAIEFKSRGKPSGIYSTKADMYAIYFESEGAVYVADTGRLRLWILENSPAIKKNTYNDSETFLFLIPKEKFIEEFTRYAIN